MGQNHQKAPRFCAQNAAFVTFCPVFERPVGNFCEDFSPKGFFDSLVRRLRGRTLQEFLLISRVSI